MSDANNISAVIFKDDQAEQLAFVVLNGYNIRLSDTLGKAGAMRSFKLKQGTVWDAWNTRQILKIVTKDGRESRIRIAAIPAEKDGAGLIEFL